MTEDLYKKAGVDTEKGDALVDWLQNETPIKSRVGDVVDGIGGFAGLFKMNVAGYREPLLVASTDGVGTKLLLGIEHQKLEGLGVDLVAMCVNDLYCLGARPLFFIDYYATGILDDQQFKQVLRGIRAGLRQCEAPLLGGETAELPGLYHKGHFDLAGFVVGVVDRDQQLGPSRVKEGDLVYALESSGFHSNGYSLLRKWLAESKGPVSDEMMSRLLNPTTIYHQIPDLVDELGLDCMHAVANITGGGISGNLPRVLPPDLEAALDWQALPTPAWMREFILSHTPAILDVEPVFNLGCGMMIVIDASSKQSFQDALTRKGMAHHLVGHIRSRQHSEGVTYL